MVTGVCSRVCNARTLTYRTATHFFSFSFSPPPHFLHTARPLLEEVLADCKKLYPDYDEAAIGWFRESMEYNCQGGEVKKKEEKKCAICVCLLHLNLVTVLLLPAYGTSFPAFLFSSGRFYWKNLCDCCAAYV